MTHGLNWEDLKPDDGFFAAVSILGEVSAELAYGLYEGGSVAWMKIIKRYEWPTAKQLGYLKRDLIFWDGLAEFQNAGGSLVDALLDIEENGVSHRTGLHLVFPGWSYFDTGVNQNGNRVHEFVSDSEEPSAKYVRWVRGEFVDYNLTAEDMKEMENVTYVGRGEATTAGNICGEGSESQGQAGFIAN